jgi:hypothetical protein
MPLTLLTAGGAFPRRTGDVVAVVFRLCVTRHRTLQDGFITFTGGVNWVSLPKAPALNVAVIAVHKLNRVQDLETAKFLAKDKILQ